MTKPRVKPPVVPAFDGLAKITGKGGWDGIPDGPNPFYVGAKDGLFIHKRTLLGRGIARVSFWPENWPKVGTDHGLFDWDAPIIPAKLMGQVVSFFERIYDKQHTEAAVLLIMHAETKEWRIFIPTQLVSHGGVNYVFEPEHIVYPWVLVGSIHSHCDFGAGHSSTDTGDADGFEGFHCTIGMIKRETPQIVAMMATNKKLLHYKPEEFPQLFDFSEAKQHEAPAWWDRYVEDTKTKTKPVGFELYAKYDRPTIVKSETKITKVNPNAGKWTPVTKGDQNTVRFNADDWYYDTGKRMMVRRQDEPRAPSKITTDKGTITVHRRGTGDFIPGVGWSGPSPSSRTVNTDDWSEFYRMMGAESGPDEFKGVDPGNLISAGYEWDNDKDTWVLSSGPRAGQPLRESVEFNARRTAERGAHWGKDDNLEADGDYRVSEDDLHRIGIQRDLYWEDLLPELGTEVQDAIVKSPLLSEDDIEDLIGHPRQAGDPDYWKTLFFEKATEAIDVLQTLGIDIKLNLKVPPPSEVPNLGIHEITKEEIVAELLPENPQNGHSPGVH